VPSIGIRKRFPG